MTNKHINHVVLMLVLILLGTPSLYAQREKNNIYLFDCTGSMKTGKLWQPAKDALYATISTQASIPGSQFTIIPFGNNPYESIIFDSKNYSAKQSNIDVAFDKYISEAKYTHISDVLRAGFSKINPNKENKIYLLTDGLPNQGDTPEKVAEVINTWCSNHKNCRLFYVALTNGVINPTIRQAIDSCPDAFIVQCEGRIIPQIADISSDVYTNLQELDKPRDISFSIPGEYSISKNTSDQYFDVQIKNNKASNGKITLTFSLKPNQDINGLHQLLQGGEYEFPIDIQCSDKKYFIANPTLSVHIVDGIQSELTIAGGEEQIKADGAKWHDSFLWSDAAAEEKVSWDLAPLFQHELAQSSITLRIEPAEGQINDFKTWYNGVPIQDNVFTIYPKQEAKLDVQFNNNASTGKRYFNLTPIACKGVDMVNGKPYNEYIGTSLRTTYDINWNPLKTLLFWSGVIILAALILWLSVLKRIFFPSIKVGRIEFTGPSSYYASKRIKGCRKVIFTNKKKSQNIVAKLMTGEIRYIQADHFSPEISLEPVGSKKKVKLRSSGIGNDGWDFYPSAIFTAYDKGSITNRQTKEKSNIEFS